MICGTWCSAAGQASSVSSGVLTLRVPDPGCKLVGLRLVPDMRIAGPLLDFRRAGDDWELVIPRPPVNRMEYLLERRHVDGSSEIGIDLANPLRVLGAFGMKSVLEFPGYRRPAWLTAPVEPGATRAIDLPVRTLGARIFVLTWAPAGTPEDEPLPLLLVHDGPEYDALASITHWLSAGVTGRRLARKQRHQARTGSAGPRCAARLALLARPASSPHAAILLGSPQ